jgi:dimethylargininase
MFTALTRKVCPRIQECELTFIDRRPIDYARAVQQHTEYKKVLQSLGVTVIDIPADPECPDCCFIEDTAVVLDEVAVVTRPGSEARRQEVDEVRPVIAVHRPLVQIDAPGTLEGGDVLRIGNTLFVGVTTRTNAQGIEMLGDHVERYGYIVIPVNVPGALHLKSVCTAISDSTVLADPTRLDMSAFSEYEVVAVPAQEWMAANVLRVNKTVCLHEGFHQTMDMLRHRGIEVQALNISEFLKAEAGLTCMSLIFRSSA